MTSATKPGRLSPVQWRLATLMGLSIFINYMDRGSLSIAAPMLKDELHLSAAQLGILLSAFFWTYAPFQLVSGWLVDRFDFRWVMAIGFFVWSSATAVTGVLHGFAALLAVRIVLGMGETVAYPTYSKILATDFGESHRGIGNALISAGWAWGPGFGIVAGGLLMSRFGWRPFFVVLGVTSLLWLWPWSRWTHASEVPRTASRDCPGVLEILSQPSAWGTFISLFGSNYLVYFLLTWLPYYLVRERHFSMDTMAKVGGAAYFVLGLSGAASGWLADYWIASGGSPTRVRKSMTISGLVLSSIFLMLCAVAEPRAAVVLLILSTASFAMFASNHWAVTQSLAGPTAAGRWTGIENFVGNLTGILAPAVTGYVVDWTGNFFWAFAITTGMVLLAASAWFTLIGPVEPVVWKRSLSHGVQLTNDIL